jgi:hypothetical protein
MMSIGGSSCSARAKMPWNYTCPRHALLQNWLSLPVFG